MALSAFGKRKLAVLGFLAASASPAFARCELPWAEPTAAQIAEYLTEWSDILILARQTGKGPEHKRYVKVVLPFKGKGDQKIILTDLGNMSQSNKDRLAQGELMLLALKETQNGEIVDNQCLSLAISKGDVDDIILSIWTIYSLK